MTRITGRIKPGRNDLPSLLKRRVKEHGGALVHSAPYYDATACACYAAQSRTREEFIRSVMDSGRKRRCHDTRAIVRLVEIRCRGQNCWSFGYAAWERMAVRWRKRRKPHCRLYAWHCAASASARVPLNEQAEFRTSLTVSGAATPFRPGTGCSIPNRYGGKKYALDEAQLKPYFALKYGLARRGFLDRQPAIRHHLRRAF